MIVNRNEAQLTATSPSSQLPPIDVAQPERETSFEPHDAPAPDPGRPTEHSREHARAHQGGQLVLRDPILAEQPSAVLLARIARLEGSLGAALSLLRRCIVERKTPTRESLAAEAGFALGMPPEAALDELDEIAQMVGVSSLR